MMSAGITSIDGSKLKTTFNKNGTSKAFLKFLNERKRNTPVLDLRRTYMEMLRLGNGLEYNDLVANCKVLEDLGVGTYFKGGDVNPDSFTWKYSLKLVAEAANRGSASQIPKLVEAHKEEMRRRATERGEQIKADKNKVGKVEKNKVSAQGTSSAKSTFNIDSKTVHVFLREGFMVELRVPTDLTKAEAQNLCQSIMYSAQ